MKYTVFVDDNFHIGEEEERYKLGEYDSCQEAVEACMKIVDDFMSQGYREGMSFKELWEGYMMSARTPSYREATPSAASQPGGTPSSVAWSSAPTDSVYERCTR